MGSDADLFANDRKACLARLSEWNPTAEHALVRDMGVHAKRDHDPINRPSHYTSHPSGIECIEVARHMNFNLGNAIKYIWRAGSKGDAVEDLRKACWYIEDEIKRLGGLSRGQHSQE